MIAKSDSLDTSSDESAMTPTRSSDTQDAAAAVRHVAMIKFRMPKRRASDVPVLDSLTGCHWAQTLLVRSSMRSRKPNIAALAQGAFYTISGLWPIVHYRSFERITGHTNQRGLARAVGVVVASIGVALIAGAFDRQSRALRWLGIGSAAALAAVDSVFATRGNGRMRRVYLADAAAEGAAIAGWVIQKRARA
jgi:hypothetical protein